MKLEINPRRPVIVRSWGGEPVALFLYAIDNKGDIAFVGNASPKRLIGVQSGDVFDFSDHRMAALMNKWETNDPDGLAGIYAAAESSCIRYQIDLDSLHGQERVAHPVGPESRHSERSRRRRVP
jgi:hypothetical protein